MPKCIAEANMLYLETPVGVGFSYSTDNSSYVAVDDEATGKSSTSKHHSHSFC
jgi:serine carboxypeptidase-like clade 2